MSSLVSFEKSLAKVSSGVLKEYHQWMADNGKSFSKINLDASKRGGRMSAIKECYANAFKLADVRRDFRYFEGHFIKDSLPVPIEHAFLVDKDGLVVDPTMAVQPYRIKQQMKKYVRSGEIPDHDWKSLQFGDEYFGVEIPLDFVREQLLIVKRWSPVAFAYFMSLRKSDL